jgi:hypothetical protein
MRGKPKDQCGLMTTVMVWSCHKVMPTSFNHKYNMLKNDSICCLWVLPARGCSEQRSRAKQIDRDGSEVIDAYRKGFLHTVTRVVFGRINARIAQDYFMDRQNNFRENI